MNSTQRNTLIIGTCLIIASLFFVPFTVSKVWVKDTVRTYKQANLERRFEYAPIWIEFHSVFEPPHTNQYRDGKNIVFTRAEQNYNVQASIIGSIALLTGLGIVLFKSKKNKVRHCEESSTKQSRILLLAPVAFEIATSEDLLAMTAREKALAFPPANFLSLLPFCF